MQKIPLFFCVFWMAFLSACGGSNNTSQPQEYNSGKNPAPAQEEAADYSFLKGSVVHQQVVYSSITKTHYPVDVYLPPGYATSDKTYPVIYATDGNILFQGLAYLLERERKEAILVAISEGPINQRAKDYLLPGARDYFKFLTVELMPLIESNYRVNEGQRSLTGTSFGGVFAIIAMFLGDVSNPHFSTIMAFESSLYRHTASTQQLMHDRYMASHEINVNLILSRSLPEGNGKYIDDFIKNLRAYDFQGLEISNFSYETTHGRVTEPSFIDSINVAL